MDAMLESRAGAGLDIELRGVRKTFHRRGSSPVEALLPIDLSIRPGEFVSLVGPSGCGKTTLLKCIAGLMRPSEGELYIGGRRVTRPDRTVSVVFQKPTLLRWYTIEENIMLPARIGHRVSPDLRRKVEDLLELTDLSDFRHSYPSELSGGMQQRAAIARALAGSPDVLVMDEPFSALDEFTRENLNDELLRLWSAQPMTVIFITHNIGEAVYLSDRVVVMAPRPGRVVGTVRIQLPRPRTSEHRTDSVYYDYVTATRDIFESAGAVRGVE